MLRYRERYPDWRITLRISIIQLIAFTSLVAIQIRSLQLQSIGLVISLIAVPVCLLILIISAFGSESRDGRLVVDENHAFRFAQTVFLWCIANFVVLGILSWFLYDFR